MTKKTRYFVLTSGAILAVGLTTGLLASYMGLPVSVFSRAAGPEELQYVPADAALVAYADVRQVMDSEFRQHFRKFEPESRERDAFEQKTGVNIEKDINTVVAVMMPQPESASAIGPDGRVLVLARGRFEQARLEALALEHGGTAEDYNGARLLTERDPQKGDPDLTIGFLAADLVAFGSYETIKAAIDAGKGGHNIASNVDLMRQIGELEGNSAWAVGRFDALTRSARLPTEVQLQLPTITWFSAAGHVNGGLNGIFRAEARDEESAKNLRDMLQGFLALGKLQAGTKPGLKELVESLQLSGEGKTVSLAFSVPSEVFETLEALSNQRRGAEIEPR